MLQFWCNKWVKAIITNTQLVILSSLEICKRSLVMCMGLYSLIDIVKWRYKCYKCLFSDWWSNNGEGPNPAICHSPTESCNVNYHSFISTSKLSSLAWFVFGLVSNVYKLLWSILQNFSTGNFSAVVPVSKILYFKLYQIYGMPFNLIYFNLFVSLSTVLKSLYKIIKS